MNSTVLAPVLPPPAAVAPSGASPRILVVDDDADLCRLEAAILNSAGFSVATALNSAAAWNRLQTDDYDLLVTDYLMPGSSGLALVRQLRVAEIQVPVVMISGTLDSLDLPKLTTDPWSRIHAFVRKPFTIQEFLSAVRSALRLNAPTTSPRHLATA